MVTATSRGREHLKEEEEVSQFHRTVDNRHRGEKAEVSSLPRTIRFSPYWRPLAIFVLLSFAGQWAIAQDTGSIQGTVTDSSGAPIFGAVVAVEGADGNRRMTATDVEGAFKISSLTPGDYSIRISAAGLSDWTAQNVRSSVNPESNPLNAVLQVAPEVTTVTVGVSENEVAEAQLNQELKQRVLGIIPNYYVSYENKPAPLSSKQKLHLGLRALLDPTAFAASGITAGIQQSMNSYHQWGQGSQGFAKRFGAAYGTVATNLMITSVLAESAFHQDPRYFYSGQGTKAQRAWYAIESAFRTKGDNGKWQPPYAGVSGAIAAAEISQLYYPGSRTQYTLLGRSLMFHFAGLVGLNLAEEFLLKKVTHHVPEVQSAKDAPVLREGSPVPLIAVDGLSAGGVTAGQTVTFVLAEDLAQSGKVLAHAGDVASGEVAQDGEATPPGDARGIALHGVMLRAGNVNVPLRSSHVRGVAGPAQYRELPESGKVEVTMFVAESVQFPKGE
jgi:carboxypeptidase family protein